MIEGFIVKLKRWADGYRCDKCWRVSTNWTKEFRELEPRSDSNGRLWVNREETGNISFGCARHPARPFQHISRDWRPLKKEIYNLLNDILQGIPIKTSMELESWARVLPKAIWFNKNLTDEEVQSHATRLAKHICLPCD